MLRIGLIQMLCEKAAIDANLDLIAHYLDEARQREIDIIGFPEMNITGYADPTRFPQAIIRRDGPEIARLLRLTRGHPSTVLSGFIEENPAGKPFITHLAARDGEMIGSYRKITIKDEEELWFSPGTEVPIFHHAGQPFGIVPFGVAICADISNPVVFAECARQGAKIVFELAAPGLYGEQATRNWQSGFRWWQGMCQTNLSRYAADNNIWIAAATQAGRTVDEDFPGGGYLFAPDGECLYATPDWSPGAVYLDVDFEQRKIKAL